MPQVEITVGGRNFEVACQDGEEQFLLTAAAMLDVEASSLSTQIGRMPESRMLLMAGLLLADRTAGLEDKVREAEGRATSNPSGSRCPWSVRMCLKPWRKSPPRPRRWPMRSGRRRVSGF